MLSSPKKGGLYTWKERSAPSTSIVCVDQPLGMPKSSGREDESSVISSVTGEPGSMNESSCSEASLAPGMRSSVGMEELDAIARGGAAPAYA